MRVPPGRKMHEVLPGETTAESHARGLREVGVPGRGWFRVGAGETPGQAHERHVREQLPGLEPPDWTK
jgi:hypothetical protein